MHAVSSVRPVSVHHLFTSEAVSVSVRLLFRWFRDVSQDRFKKKNIKGWSIKCKESFLSCWELAGLLQQFVLFESKRHAHRHFCDEPFAGRLGHLLAEAKVDLADASAALEKV